MDHPEALNSGSTTTRKLASRVAEALDHAARNGTAPNTARQLDGEALRLLQGSPELDPALAELDLASLAGLLERSVGYAEGGDPVGRRLAWDALDVVRRPVVLRRIDPAERDAWARRMLATIDASHLSVGPLFRQRAERYGSRVLFEIPRHGSETRRLTWRQTAARVEFLARGLLSLDSSETPARIAILSDNRLEMALVDLACLGAGLVNVIVPANATEADVAYMLEHSRAGTVIVSDATQLQKVQRNRESLTHLRRVICMDAAAAHGESVMNFDELRARATHIPASLVVARSEAVRMDDPATIMYTSGTTGTPKGILFNQRNLVFKRFARALALPEIGENDRFLCYLPLYHTFGRYFEMLGCVFWGATYCFLESTSSAGLVAGMRRHRPSVFISVPKKWIQLYESVARRADPLEASDEVLTRVTGEVTGGQLRWGLSAAGHLDPDIFRFFQRHGVELLSGFGMTEATGGITMTPPGDYRDDSLGPALPGIELKVAEDGELLVRGPYVMVGYYESPDGEPSFDEDGWLHTGDLMEVDRDRHLRLIDRKKEIYKNIKGETIAPQRIEKPFRDFESVGRAFLVGDHREYNTLLIWPNPADAAIDRSTMSADDLHEHFRSLVVSVNKFLAPYERIVDFALIDRDLDAERGELTPKGTVRRSVVARNFADVIQALYRRTNLQVDGVELTLPNRLLQALGLTAQNFRIRDGQLTLPSAGTALGVQRVDGRRVRVGSCIYRHPAGPLNLGNLLTTPRLWLGNRELVEFAPLKPTDRQRPSRGEAAIEWCGHVEGFRGLPDEADAIDRALSRPQATLDDLDLAARLLGEQRQAPASQALRVVERILEDKLPGLSTPARAVLLRLTAHPADEVRRRALVALIAAESESRLGMTLRRFLAADPEVLDEATRRRIAETDLSPAKVEALIRLTESSARASDGSVALAGTLLQLLADYGAAHPTRYQRLRAFLTRMSLFAGDAELRQRAERCVATLRDGFRAWLGPATRIAVDPENGREYRWEDVVVFEEGIPPDDRRRLLSAIQRTAFLREAFFLFSAGAVIHLSDIPPGGVWIRLIGSRHGKRVYRITVQTRYQGAYELAANVNDNQPAERVQEEIHWLIISGERGNRDRLVEDFGGYWPEQDLWSEEFVSGETLDRALRRLARDEEKLEGFRQAWSFLAWSTLGAYVDFWNRTGRRWEIADPSLTNVVVPQEDYHGGARIVSLSARRPHRGMASMLVALREQFVQPAEEQHPGLAGVVGWPVIFSALLETVGDEEGLALLTEVGRSTDGDVPEELATAAREWTARTVHEGFAPMRLHFAVERYRRWEQLGDDATVRARARTLQELYETYGLAKLTPAHPEIRFRFFRDTVFRNADPALLQALDDLIGRIRRGEVHEEDFVDAVTDLRSHIDPGAEVEYFLPRLSLPHLRPEDSAGFARSYLGGRYQSEIVVSLEDRDGERFRVRHALNPKEVERLHRLFVAARLEVQFRSEHQYLVAINERGQIIAGIFYEIEAEGPAAHLEKIVVSDRYRRKGVADGLMQEFFNRLRAAGVKTVTTGFFRPEYFYAYGFSIEKRYAGLVKTLE